MSLQKIIQPDLDAANLKNLVAAKTRLIQCHDRFKFFEGRAQEYLDAEENGEDVSAHDLIRNDFREMADELQHLCDIMDAVLAASIQDIHARTP